MDSRSAKDLKVLGEKLQSNGHTFHAFKTLDLIPQLRLETYLARNFEYENLRITLPRLQAFTQTVNELGNQGRFTEIIQLNGYLDNLLEKPITKSTMIYLAAAVVVMDDEPLNEVDSFYENQKIEQAENNAEIRSFFLTVLLALNQTLRDSSKLGQPLDFSNPRQMIVEQLFEQMIIGV